MPREFNSDSFYTFLTEGKFMGTQCNQCNQLSVEPRILCSKCHSKDIEWYEFNGTGYLSTFTCISIVPVSMSAKGYGRDKPYCTGIVTLEEGPRISAMINGVDGTNPQDIETGMDMVLDTENLDDESPALAFKPA